MSDYDGIPTLITAQRRACDIIGQLQSHDASIRELAQLKATYIGSTHNIGDDELRVAIDNIHGGAGSDVLVDIMDMIDDLYAAIAGWHSSYPDLLAMPAA